MCADLSCEELVVVVERRLHALWPPNHAPYDETPA
jgi:hypothetical protein